MRIQHNIQSLNAQRNLTKNNNALNKNIEKLSSGFRINRAGDDAAGLAICPEPSPPRRRLRRLAGMLV